MSQHPLIGGLIVTHGQLGHELVAAAEMIVGEISHIVSVSIGWHDDVNQSKKDIEEAVRTIDAGKGVIILTDMFGGTPSNITLSLLKKDKVEIVTGVNLPMIVRLATQTEQDSLSELATKVRDQGQSHISMASEFLEHDSPSAPNRE